MKVIFMNCSYKRSGRKAQKKVLDNLFSLKAMKKLKNMNEEEQESFFKNLNNDLACKNKQEFERMYLNYFISSKKIKKNSQILNEINQVASDVEENKELSITDNKAINKNMADLIKNTSIKLGNFMGKKTTKFVLFGAIAIALTLSCYRLEYSVAPCFADGISSIDTAFYYIRMISGVICFVCMTIEIIQNAVQGDVRVIWYVVAKYLAIMVAILSFRKVFNIIDSIFNG